MRNSAIKGCGYYVPEQVVTNDDLSQKMDTNDEWIRERTGIEERRFSKKGGEESTSNMGVKAAKMAIENAGVSVDDIQLIIFATLSPDYYFPGSGVLVQEKLGMKNTTPALDIRNQCSGFVYGLSVADQFIKTGMYDHVLLVGSEMHSGGLDMTTRGRGVSVIFGDGAGAVVLGPAKNADSGILSTHLHSEGKYAEELSLLSPSTNHWIPEIMDENDPEDTSYYPYMNGNFVFKHAVTRFPQVIMEGLQANDMTPADIDLLIPHQANLRITQFVGRTMKLKEDQVYSNIQKYGNTTAASVPIALAEAVEKGKIKDGDRVVLAAFGSGFTWASAIMRWEN